MEPMLRHSPEHCMAEPPNSTTDPESELNPEAPPDQPMSFWQRWGEMLIAAVVIALGIVILIETQDIRVSRAFARVSPRAIPQIVGGGLLLVGLWYVVAIIRNPPASHGEASEDTDPEAETDWSVIGIIGVGLVSYALLMENAGFIVASAVLFFISAFAMGSRRFSRDIAIAVLISVAIFLMFDTWLGVRLPAGELGAWISREL